MCGTTLEVKLSWERNASWRGRPLLTTELSAGTKDKPERNERIYQPVYAHGYTLKEVAELLEVHYSTISVIANRAAAVKKHQK